MQTPRVHLYSTKWRIPMQFSATGHTTIGVYSTVT